MQAYSQWGLIEIEKIGMQRPFTQMLLKPAEMVKIWKHGFFNRGVIFIVIYRIQSKHLNLKESLMLLIHKQLKCSSQYFGNWKF